MVCFSIYYLCVIASAYVCTIYDDLPFCPAPGYWDEGFEIELAGGDEVLSLSPHFEAELPEYFNVADLGVLHPAIWQGSGCGSCGWVSGTQTLEARMALVSENYIPYSVQNFMNCDESVCVATQPYKVNSLARKNPEWIVRESEVPYTKKDCLKTSPPSCACSTGSTEYTRVTDEQFAFVGPNVNVRTEEEARQALLSGPLTTCFAKPSNARNETGERCAAGCGHANSIIGYSREQFYIQESYGLKYGPFDNGTWLTSRGSICANHLILRGVYPMVFYDYDRANAFFTDISVDETELIFVDKETFGDHTRNIGVAKNKCAFIGSACRGVIALSSGAFELVADFGAGSTGAQKASKKTQMVVYLKHEETGKYIGLDSTKDLVAVEKAQAAPFFTSHSRFISYDFPQYHVVNNRLSPIVIREIRDIDPAEVWSLRDCNLRGANSGLSLDLVDDEFYGKTIGGVVFDKASPSQRFDIGISGVWMLNSTALGLPLRREKDKKRFRYIFSNETYPGKKKAKFYVLKFRWNARQLMVPYNGKTIDHETMKFSENYFDFSNITDNSITPTDCTILKLAGGEGETNYLSLNDEGKVVMTRTSDMDGKWTFEYADL